MKVIVLLWSSVRCMDDVSTITVTTIHLTSKSTIVEEEILLLIAEAKQEIRKNEVNVNQNVYAEDNVTWWKAKLEAYQEVLALLR